MSVIRVRRVGTSVVHATGVEAPTAPSEKHGRMVRVLKASRVIVACGATLQATEEKPILVLRNAATITCRGCARAAT